MSNATPPLSLADASRPHPRDTTSFAITFPAGWEQGPGTYGGLVLAALADAASAVAGAERPLRSLAVQLAGPVRAEVASSIEVEVVRAGKRVQQLGLRLSQGDETVCLAQAVAGADRERGLGMSEVPMPEAPAPDAVTPVVWSAPMPAFLQHLELRPCVGGYPGSRGEARSGGWVRLREPGTPSPEALAVALIDAYWPALLVRASAMIPMASQTISVHFVGALEALDPARPALVMRETRAARAGYADESSWLWSAGGELVAVAHQLIVSI